MQNFLTLNLVVNKVTTGRLKKVKTHTSNNLFCKGVERSFSHIINYIC